MQINFNWIAAAFQHFVQVLISWTVRKQRLVWNCCEQHSRSFQSHHFKTYPRKAYQLISFTYDYRNPKLSKNALGQRVSKTANGLVETLNIKSNLQVFATSNWFLTTACLTGTNVFSYFIKIIRNNTTQNLAYLGHSEAIAVQKLPNSKNIYKWYCRCRRSLGYKNTKYLQTNTIIYITDQIKHTRATCRDVSQTICGWWHPYGRPQKFFQGGQCRRFAYPFPGC